MKKQILLALCAILMSGTAFAETLTIENKDGKKNVFNIEVADTRGERAQGLMGRESLDVDAGMLFIFEFELMPQFWMKDTRIPLDVIYIGKDGEVKGVHENARPFDKTPFSTPQPILAALEVRAGTAKTLGISRGSKVIYKLFEKGLK